jgi:branched-chain amino acid transport system permease protein
MIAIIIVIARRLDNSPIGRAWTAIREDEVAAIAMGVPLVRMKLLAFATGAAFAGAIGVLYAAKQTFVSPESFSFIQSISILAMVIVGGLGGIRGVILGAMCVTLLNLHVLTNLSLQINSLKQVNFVVPIINFHITDWPTQLEPAKYQRFVFGMLLVLMMIFRPSGLLPEPRRKLEMNKHLEGENLPNPKSPTQAVTPAPPGE